MLSSLILFSGNTILHHFCKSGFPLLCSLILFFGNMVLFPFFASLASLSSVVLFCFFLISYCLNFASLASLSSAVSICFLEILYSLNFASLASLCSVNSSYLLAFFVIDLLLFTRCCLNTSVQPTISEFVITLAGNSVEIHVTPFNSNGITTFDLDVNRKYSPRFPLLILKHSNPMQMVFQKHLVNVNQTL